MGKARILEHIGEGEYLVEYQLKDDETAQRKIDLQKEILRKQAYVIPDLEARITALQDEIELIEQAQDEMIEAFNDGDLEDPDFTVPTVDPDDVLIYINGKRTTASVPTLTKNNQLMSAAQAWAEAMSLRGNLSSATIFIDNNNQTPESAARTFGYVWQEKPTQALSMSGMRDLENVIDTWETAVRSGPIMLDAEWDNWGMGFVQTNFRYKYYFTCFFARMAPLP